MIIKALPDLSKDELADILEMRSRKKDDPMVGLGMEIVEAMFPPEDMKVIEELWNAFLFNQMFTIVV